MKIQQLILGCLLCCGCIFSMAVVAEEDAKESEEAAESEGEEGDAAGSAAIYLPLKPAFVVNYGGKGRLKYIKSELSVRLSNSNAANSLRHHMPLVRHEIVMIFSRQTDEGLGTQDGKEAMRQEILEVVRKVIKEQDGQEGVVDVFFNTLMIQR